MSPGWLDWQYMIFLAPLAASILLALLTATGTLGHHGPDHSIGEIAHPALESHLDMSGHDIHAEMSGHDIHAEAAGDHGDIHGDHDTSYVSSLLAILGIGKAPISLLMVSGSFLWGAGGLTINRVLGTGAMAVNFVGAGVLCMVGTRLLAEGFARLIPNVQTYHVRRSELAGEVGKALYTIHEKGGIVRVIDPLKTMRDLECRTYEGDTPISAGSDVVLCEYDSLRGIWLVRRREEVFKRLES